MTTSPPDSITAAACVAGRPSSRLPWPLLTGLALVLLALWLLPLEGVKRSHGLFPLALHTVSEIFAVIVAMLVFAVAWNAYARERAGNILILACAFLGVGLLDFGHALSYQGMPDLVTPASPGKAIDFWLTARLLAALALLTAALRPWTPLRRSESRYRLLAGVLAATGAVFVLQLYWPEVWPLTFVPGQGLTPFKVGAEFGIIAILALAAWRFHRLHRAKAPCDAANLFAACLIGILSELCFTLYTNVHDLFSLVGHLYKIVAYLFIYRAIFVASVREPYRRLEVAIAERQAAENRVEYLAYHDALTGLPNRMLLQDRLEQAMVWAGRSGTKVALLFLDLDNFKAINDSLGHAASDDLLKTLAANLKASLRNTDTISRQSGDEFVMVLSGLDNREECTLPLAQIMEGIQAPIHLGDTEIALSASIGIALYPDDGQTFDALLQKAETAMYTAKEAGRNAYRFFDESMSTEAVANLALRNGLRRALEQNQFVLHYQPQIDLASGAVIGVEALIRWQHPDLGLLAPGRFIAVAEDSGLIVPMGEWVIEEACRQGARWRRAGLPPLVVAVNLSAIQFRRGNVEQTVMRALEASGLPPEWLELELTESILLQGTDSVFAIVRELKRHGVKFSIDDFGTGYSSLSYLKRFAVDKLKIDQSFVRDLAPDSDDAAIIRAIVQMAHSLGLRTIAEGVETEDTLELLRRFGCDEAQGYHFARPMPAEAINAYLAKSHQPLAMSA